MGYSVSVFLKYSFSIVSLLYPIKMLATDVYGPKPFNQIIELNFTNTWSPNIIGSIQNREHVLLIDAETMSKCLTVDSSDPYLLGVGDVSTLSGGLGTYGNVMRSIFQILDLNTAVLSTESLTNTYTFHSWLASYHAIDADTVASSESAGSIVIRDKNSFYMLEQSTIAFLVFTMAGTPSSTTVQATSRYVYNTELDSAIYELDANWSASQWLKMEASSVGLTSIESEATEFMLADANDLIDVSVPGGSGFNPNGTEWQTNSFAGWPIDPNTGEEAVWIYDDSQLNSDWFLEQVDDYYETQFGDSDEASAAASDFLDAIEATLASQGASLRYPKDVYLTFRESMLNYDFSAADMYNSVLGESTVENIYFTNAADDNGVYHPFMVIASHNAPSGPQFLIDVARPPGDGSGEGYAESNVTRNAVLEAKLVKIPLRDYGLISSLTDNDLSEYGTLAEDMGLTEDEWTVDNYASLSSSAIAVDGVMIYPASNNVLVYATFMAEITESGIHVGRGMGFHYHADGHSFNGNGINLYNLSDYEGHTHPPIIGFVFDGISLFGKYESSYNSADGYGETLDDYNGHTHGDYGYHYHAYSTEVTQSENDVSATYIQHFLYRGAFKGLVNDIPGLFEVSPNQFMNNEIKRYVGAVGTVMEIGYPNFNRTPQLFTISQNFPNPFNPVTTFKFDLPLDAFVSIGIYDIMGKEVVHLMKSYQVAGYRSYQWDGRDTMGRPVSAGVYLYQIQAGEFVETKKMVLLK